MDNRQQIANDYMGTIENWKTVLDFIGSIMTEIASNEPDNDVLESALQAAYDDITASEDRTGQQPRNLYRFTTETHIFEFEFSARCIESEAKPHDPHHPSQP